MRLDRLLKFWISTETAPYAEGKHDWKRRLSFCYLGEQTVCSSLRLRSARDNSVWVFCGFITVREDFRRSLFVDLHWEGTRGPLRDLRVNSLEEYPRHRDQTKTELSLGHVASARELSGSWVSTHRMSSHHWNETRFHLCCAPDKTSYRWGNTRPVRGPGPNRLSMRGGHPLLTPLDWYICKHLQSLESNPGGGGSQLKYELIKEYVLCSPNCIYPGALWAHCQCQG